ncbi:MAG: DUF3151 domain-containing protein [Mycobacteriales bacterium]
MRLMPSNLLPEPAATRLPENVDAQTALAQADDPAQAVARFPAWSRGWAELADRAYADGRIVDSYAYARVGYHRGLDALRRAGWKGFGPVPWSHEPNRGFLRCVHALARAAGAIGESEEVTRCTELLDECDPAARRGLDG